MMRSAYLMYCPLPLQMTPLLRAIDEARLILTQDLDFTGIIALSGEGRPSLLVLRLSSARVELVNTILARVLPQFERELTAGAIITVEDQRVRRRSLPIP